MKQINYLFFILMGALLASSCSKKIEEKSVNPNNSATVQPGLILGTVLTAISGSQGAGTIGALAGVNSWDNVGDWNQYHCQNYDYYGNNIYSWLDNSTHTETHSNNTVGNYSDGPFNSYLVLKDVVQMEDEVTSRGGSALNPYEAIGRFVKAYYFYNMTSLMGDVPLTQALQSPAINSPAYTSQEQVFLYVLNQLDTANTHIATLIANKDNSLAASASQDIYYNGSLSQWQKAVNSFK
jgi:hypothetical protein